MALSADSGKATNQGAIFQAGYEWQADPRPAGGRRIRKGRAALPRAPDGVAAYQLRPTRQETRIYRYVRSNRCRSRLCLTNLSGLAGMRWRNVQADKRNIFIHFDHMLFILLGISNHDSPCSQSEVTWEDFIEAEHRPHAVYACSLHAAHGLIGSSMN